MGFKKTEKGNLIYEFDFTPTKLVPLANKDRPYWYGPQSPYIVLGNNGEKAPIIIDFENVRHTQIGAAFATSAPESDGLPTISSIVTNVAVIATLCKMSEESEAEAKRGEENPIDYWDTDHLASIGKDFNISSIQESKDYLERKGYPQDGYKFIRGYM